MTLELFNDPGMAGPDRQELAAGALVLRRFAQPSMDALIRGLSRIIRQSPFRHWQTPGGHRMSVAMSNCGALGWVSDHRGYRYQQIDPNSGQPWPEMPQAFKALAKSAAAEAGFDGFVPDSCLINQYEPGARMSLHQDKNERDFGQPIVSVSLGIAAVFEFGGISRGDRVQAVPLQHADVMVWGGPARLRFHGVRKLSDAEHPVLGRRRINLTFRHAG
ncbi:DNA oxidative demethylase AlkB [Bradymonas sediminis]|uniref:DNA oxidative demethylase AlkB n=1 Tax=Bradymonas sediminis TaxID=1548548 RepID=A0A2Z4FJ74_9DELT|nr:DNA oxidative demethylase AlkB [Bradymonas sediminis]AWV88890.1 DNA oxidative demethylase AlkB [Bradymonas sediminis]TDP71895.1 alkylated DNA repair protein (DNA oxidative demethylase) [Bradymonas sediminis]